MNYQPKPDKKPVTAKTKVVKKAAEASDKKNKKS